MPNLGMSELVVILVIVLVLFGAKKLPELARNMGKSVNLFKSGLKEGMEEDKGPKNEPAQPEDKKPG